MDRLTLVNATPDTRVYGAAEREASHRADLLAEFPADDLRDRVLRPGAATAVPVDSIGDYRLGATVRFFWRVRADRARYRGSLDATAADLARQRYRVEVTAAALGPALPWRRRAALACGSRRWWPLPRHGADR